MLQPISFKVFISNVRNHPALEQVGIKLFGEKIQHFTVTGISNLPVSAEQESTYVVLLAFSFLACFYVCFFYLFVCLSISGHLIQGSPIQNCIPKSGAVQNNVVICENLPVLRFYVLTYHCLSPRI